MHVQNNIGSGIRGLKGFYPFSRAFSFLLFLSLLFILIFPSSAASAQLSSETRALSALQVPGADSLAPTPRIITAAQDFSPENASNTTITPSIVVLDGEDIYVQSGEYHSFYQGYRLYVKGTSTEGKRVWLELTLGNESLQDLIATEGSRFVYSKNSSEVLNLTVDTIYSGTEGVLVRFAPVYQYLDRQLPRPVESEDSKPMYPIIPSQPGESENNRVDGFGSSLSLVIFLGVVLLMGLFTDKAKNNLNKK